MTAMPAASHSSPLAARLLDMLVSPGDVFDEILAAPPRLANWLVPTLLVALTSLFLLGAASNEPSARSGKPEALDSAAPQAEPGTADWQRVSAVVTSVGASAGTFWSAFLLWFIGRAFLRARFAYWKAVEVVALTNIILALGAVVTALLISASGDPASRPALSFFARHLPSTSHVHLALDTLNVFHLWTTTVLAIGFSRLSGVSFKQSACWVFGYWFAFRLAVILLA
jgi:hypothetical protein